MRLRPPSFERPPATPGAGSGGAPPLGEGPAEPGFLDTFLARSFANTLSMVGIAAGVMWYVGQQNAEQAQRVDNLRDEVALLRMERDRMQAVAGELAREVHDAGMESEIVRWQLAYTEERLRRSQAEVEGTGAQRVASRAEPGVVSKADLKSMVAAKDRFQPVRFEPLDDRAADALGRSAPGSVALEGPASMNVDNAPMKMDGDPGTAFARMSMVPFEGAASRSATRLAEITPDDLDPGIPSVGGAYSQLARDRAYGVWAGIVHDAVSAECGRRRSEAGQYRCSRDLRRALLPYSRLAVECMLSGNATPDYSDQLDPDRLPSHAVPLDHGAVLLCDGALPNF